MSDFQELSAVEKNAEKYYKELSDEETNFRKQLEEHLKLNKKLTEEVMQLESKLEVVNKNTALLGVDDLKKKLDALNQMIGEVDEQNTHMFEENIQFSSELVEPIASESRKLEDMRKAYSDPGLVEGAVKTATAQFDQAQQTLNGLEKELGELKMQQSSFQARVSGRELKIMDWILSDMKKQAEEMKLVNKRNEQK